MTFMSNLTIRTRLLIGVLVPVLITAGTIAWITANQIRANGEAELQNSSKVPGLIKLDLRSKEANV